jgi:hypothetical protein
MGGNIPNPDSTGYIKYYAADSLRADDQLFTQNDLFYVDFGIDSGASSPPPGIGGCNIDFNTFFNIDWNLDFAQFEVTPSVFDSSLFDKCDAISLEVSMINDMLINSILDMECCDIAHIYNSTLVPFFKFFADSDGDSLITVMVRFAEIITSLRAIVEPLDCLVRFIPNNPWLPKDVDLLSWIYGYFKKTAPFLNRILSGELLDIVLNPVHQVRTKMQACLYGGIPAEGLWNSVTETGSAQQLEAISELAAKNGYTIVDYSPPPMDKPIKPKPEEHGGEDSIGYKEALKLYNQKKKDWDFYQARQKTIQEEQKRRSIVTQNINQHLGVAVQTKAIIKVKTNGLCGCISDALGIKEVTIENIPFRTTSDLYNQIVGKTHAKATYKDIGAVSKNEPKNEKATIQEKHITSKNVKTKIVNASDSSGSAGKKVIKKNKKVSWSNPYSIYNYGPQKIEEIVITYDIANNSSKAIDIINTNDKTEKIINNLQEDAKKLENEKEKINQILRAEWTNDKLIVEKILEDARKNLDTVGRLEKEGKLSKITSAAYSKQLIEYEVALNIFNSYFGTFIPFDFENDPEDYTIVSMYLPNLVTQEHYPPEYWDTVENFKRIIEEEFGPELRALPFPPNTPPENIIDSLPISTDVDVNERFQINYFNGGFVREKGSSSWRNFNKLDIPYNDLSIQNGAIQKDKSTPEYMAIFPSDTIGDKAQIEYLKSKTQPYAFLKIFAPEELKYDDAANADKLLKILEDKYGYTWDQHFTDFSDEDLLNIINEISIMNGYEEGKLWVKTRLTDPSERFNIDFEYEKNGSEVPRITLGDKIIPKEYLEILNDSVANQVAKKTNASIEKRADKYVKASKIEVKRQEIGKNIDTSRYAIMNSIAGFFPAEMDFMIPCTCENFLCRLLNYIIQYFMSAFQALLDQIMDMIIRFLIVDWIEDLLRTIQDFLACLGSVFGGFAAVANIHEYSNDLLDAMRNRIRLYPADPCFLPDEPFVDPLQPPLPGDGWGGGDPTDWEFPAPYDPPPGTYYPPTGGGGDGGGGGIGDGYSPPPVIYPPVIPGPGDQGGNYPAFRFQCEYLWL